MTIDTSKLLVYLLEFATEVGDTGLTQLAEVRLGQTKMDKYKELTLQLLREVNAKSQRHQKYQ